jgi:hypothetical protein
MKLRQGLEFTAKLPVYTGGDKPALICKVTVKALVLKVCAGSGFTKRITFLVTKTSDGKYFEVGKVYHRMETWLTPLTYRNE